MIEKYTQEKDKLVCKDFHIEEAFLMDWIETHKENPQVKKVLSKIRELDVDIYEKNEMTSFEFNLPSNYNVEMHVRLTRKLFACLRYEQHKLIEEHKTKNGVRAVDAAVIKELMAEADKKRDSIR